jgi:uncharacterized protein (TIGR03435 family)
MATVVVSMISGTALPVRTQAQLLHPSKEKLPSFEVATIRPSHSSRTFVNYHIAADRFTAENATLTALIQFAYGIKSDDQLPDEPKWVGSLRFDIDAKVEDSEIAAIDNELPDQRLDRCRLMMQSLLADRFKLKINTRTRDAPVYALTVAKNGPKLTPAKEPTDLEKQRTPTLTGGSRGELKAGAVSMELFADWLSGRPETGGRVVTNETGLNGHYDFTLTWTPDDGHNAQLSGAGASQGPAISPTPVSAAPSFLTALQEQLGLKLKSRRARVEVVVIDHVEQPSPN